MAYGLADRDAVDELFSLSLEEHLTPTQPGSLRMVFPPSMRPLPDDDTLRQPSRLRLPSPPSTKPTEDEVQHIYSDSNSISTLSSAPPSPSPTPAPSRVSAEALSPSSQALLLSRIHTGLSYTRARHSLHLPVTQTTRFALSPLSPTHLPALALLRKHATLISASPTRECYELGIPRPDWVQGGAITGVHDAQWWMGKSRAEIKAGPWAGEGEVRMAEARIRGLETRRRKRRGRRGRERECKLREGVRLAEMGEGSDEYGDEKMRSIVEEEDEEEQAVQPEVQEEAEDEGEAMEGVEYGCSKPVTTSSRKLRGHGSSEPSTGSESTPCSVKLKSQTGTKSLLSSRKSRTQGGSESPAGPRPSTGSRRLRTRVDPEFSPPSKKLRSQDGSEPSKTSSRKLRSQGDSRSSPSTMRSRN